MITIGPFVSTILASAQGERPLDLRTAAAQFITAGTAIVLGVCLLISIAAFLVMRLYMRRVFRESQRPGSPSDSDRPVDEAPGGPLLSKAPPLEIQIERPCRPVSAGAARSETFRHADSAFRAAAGIYVLGGAVHVATLAGLLFLFGFPSVSAGSSRLIFFGCYAATFWSWFAIAVTMLALFWGPQRSFRWALILGYVAVLPALGALLHMAGTPRLSLLDVGSMSKSQADLVLAIASALTGQELTAVAVTVSPLLQPFIFWSQTPSPLLVLLPFFSRFVRGTVGPLFITMTLMVVLFVFVIGDLALGTSPGLWLMTALKKMLRGSNQAVLTTLLVICLSLSAILACLGLLWIGRRYRCRQLSDQTFLFDCLWLSGSLWLCVLLMGGDYRFSYLMGLLPFALYKITVGLGSNRIAARAQRLPKGRLLFLRVFGPSTRSEKLFDLLAARWRYAGDIRLIGATDIVRSRFEPDEFLDFLAGRLAKGYISTVADLDRRVADRDLRTDPDGRYRVDEFFCRADMWQPTVIRLMEQSHVVAMDLRGFTSERQGAIFELGALIDNVPLRRFALLVDRTTDEPLLRQTLADLWRKMSPRSPNASSGPARLRIIDLACGYPAAVRRLLQLGDEILASSGS